jgi:uncharacterized protein
MPDNPKLLIDGPHQASWTIALAHGAGAPMDSPFMNTMALGLTERGYRVARFEFPYMAERRLRGARKPPDREPILRETWLNVVKALGRDRLVIGGKSMGGRIASLIADEAAVAGLVCLGYPFHPVGKPAQLRVKHLTDLQTPTLILQGERDSFGGREEVAAYELSPAIRVQWLTDGDHSFKPRKKAGLTEAQNWEAAIAAIDAFIQGLAAAKSSRKS